MTIHLRSGNMAETCHVDEKVDYHVSAKRKRNGYKQIHVSVGFTKYGNMQFRPVESGEFDESDRCDRN